MDSYFVELKKNLEKKIPSYDTSDFKKLTEGIKKKLEKKESDFIILVRSLKILVLGDWHTERQRKILTSIKGALLKIGLYARTIDNYYDANKSISITYLAIKKIFIYKQRFSKL